MKPVGMIIFLLIGFLVAQVAADFAPRRPWPEWKAALVIVGVAFVYLVVTARPRRS